MTGVQTCALPIFIKAEIHLFVDIIKGIWSIFGDDLKKIWSGIWDAISGIFDFFKNLFTGKWSKLGDDLKKIFGGLGEILSGIFGGIFDGALHALQAGWNLFARMVNSLLRQIQKIPGFSWIPLLPEWHDEMNHASGAGGGARRAFATGGIVTGPTNALIGEAGPEAVKIGRAHV